MNAPATPSSSEASAPRPRRPPWWIAAFLLLMVLVPVLFWRGTWFGRTLSEEETSQYLGDTEHPRKVQHALIQIGERITRNDPGVKRWYPQVVALAHHAKPEIRATAAWVMGQDNHASEFHAVLLGLIEDPDPLVRQNAALSLVRFGDAGGRAVLRQMLLPYPVESPASGTLEIRLRELSTVNPGTLLGKISDTSGNATEIRSPLPGAVQRWLARSGEQIHTDEPIVLLSPDEAQVWEALRALYLVGEPEDVELIDPYTHGAPRMTARIQEQAELTLKSIRARAGAGEKAGEGPD